MLILQAQFIPLPLFRKQERLHLKKDILHLFENGEKWACFPFRVLLRCIVEGEDGVQVSILVSVSKRNFKKATDRNRLKRQMREAFRLRKDAFYKRINDLSSEKLNLVVHIGLIYTSKNKEAWVLFEKKMDRALDETYLKIKTTYRNLDAQNI